MHALGVAGFSPEEVDALDPTMDDEAFQEMVRKRLLGAMANNGASQNVIGMDEVERFLRARSKGVPWFAVSSAGTGSSRPPPSSRYGLPSRAHA